MRNYDYSAALTAALLMLVLPMCVSQQCEEPTKYPECPFAGWADNSTGEIVADKRYCYECRWCPFRADTCCEKKDEIELLKNISVSGSSDWSCFITIAHFQECGKCSPESSLFTIFGEERYLNYAPNAKCMSIAICTEACGYIYKQCKGTKKIDGNYVITAATEQEFCSAAHQREKVDGLPCYNAGNSVDNKLLSITLLLFVMMFVFV